MEQDVSNVVLQIVEAIIESDQYLEWATFNEEEPFEVESLLKFLSDENELIILESQEDED